MERDSRLLAIIEFLSLAEKLKVELRHSWSSNPARQESVAEHTWMVALLAMLLFEEMEEKLDQLKVLKMILVHDIVEAIAGDVPIGEISDRQLQKEANEQRAILEIEQGLSQKTGSDIRALWEEFEARETAEAKFVKALDRIEAAIQHNISPIETWDEQDFRVCIGYKVEYYSHTELLQRMRELVDQQTLQKVMRAQQRERLSDDQVRLAEKGMSALTD